VTRGAIAALLVGVSACGEPSGIAPPSLTIVTPRENDTVLAGEAIVLRAAVDGRASSRGVAVEWVTPWGRVIGEGDSAIGRLADTGTYAVALLARSGRDVLASDRVTVTVVPNDAPVVAIEPIPRPCRVYVTDTVRLVAQATDAESAARVEWFSDRSGPIGTGDTLAWVPGNGTEGQHFITARALDAQGNRDVDLAILWVLGGPRFKWAREYPAVARVGACGGSAGGGVTLPFARGDDGTLVAAMTTPGDFDAVWSLTAAGDVRWVFETRIANEHFAGLVVARGGRVFFADYDGVFHALGTDGTELWSADVLGNDWHGRPALAPDGALYVSGGSPDNAGIHDLVRIDPETGRDVWRVHRSVGGRSCLAVLADGHLEQTNGLWALDVRPDGTIERVDSTVVGLYYTWYGMCAFDEAGIGYHALSYGLTAVRRDHTVAWYDPNHVGEPAIGADGAVYAVAGDTVRRLSPDGQVRWAKGHPGESPQNGRMALLADGTLWVGSGRFLTRFHTQTGAQLDQVELADLVMSAPVVAPDGTLYVVTGGNRLVAIDGGAPLDSLAPWPTWRRDNRRTASVPRP
jgi:outer membrane protein assembly factor BamB